MTFDRDLLDRYGRQILLDEVGIEGQQRLFDAHVLVVGAGGLGAPILPYLAGAGVGRITLLDPDTVDLTNLHRQVLFGTEDVGRPKAAVAAARLQAINPTIEVDAHAEALTRDNALDFVQAADVVVDGSDTFPSRYLANDACVLADRPLVHGAVARFDGQVGVFHARTADGALGPCYRCLHPEPPEPGTVPSCAEAGVLGPLPGVIGAWMAAEALKLIAGIGPGPGGRLLHIDLVRNSVRSFEVPRNRDCAVCGDAPTVHELLDYETFCGLA